MEQVDLTKLSIVELKALAYDMLAQIQTCQNNLKLINERLAQLNNVTPQPEPEPTPDPEPDGEPEPAVHTNGVVVL